MVAAPASADFLPCLGIFGDYETYKMRKEREAQLDLFRKESWRFCESLEDSVVYPECLTRIRCGYMNRNGWFRGPGFTVLED